MKQVVIYVMVVCALMCALGNCLMISMDDANALSPKSSEPVIFEDVDDKKAPAEKKEKKEKKAAEKKEKKSEEPVAYSYEEPVAYSYEEPVAYQEPAAYSYDYNGDGLNPYSGVNYYNGRTETYYSSNVLYHYQTPEWTCGSDGVYRDADGYVVVAASDIAMGSTVDTSFGAGKVYDTGCAGGVTDIYTNW